MMIGRNRLGQLAGTGALVACMAAASLSSAGCLNYGNYPRANKDLTWHNSRVTAGVLELMEQSLGYVIADDASSQPQFATPPAGEPLAAVNLPGGVSPAEYRRVAQGAYPGVVPLSESRSDLPVYQIGQIRLRGGDVEVYVLRPSTGLERGVSNPTYSGLQLSFKGGSGSWRIVEQRSREIGTLDQPRWVPIEMLERAQARNEAPEAEIAPEAAPEDGSDTEAGSDETPSGEG